MNLKVDERLTFEKIEALIEILRESINPSEMYVLADLIAAYHGMAEMYYNRWKAVLKTLKKVEGREC